MPVFLFNVYVPSCLCKFHDYGIYISYVYIWYISCRVNKQTEIKNSFVYKISKEQSS